MFDGAESPCEARSSTECHHGLRQVLPALLAATASRPDGPARMLGPQQPQHRSNRRCEPSCSTPTAQGLLQELLPCCQTQLWLTHSPALLPALRQHRLGAEQSSPQGGRPPFLPPNLQAKPHPCRQRAKTCRSREGPGEQHAGSAGLSSDLSLPGGSCNMYLPAAEMLLRWEGLGDTTAPLTLPQPHGCTQRTRGAEGRAEPSLVQLVGLMSSQPWGRHRELLCSWLQRSRAPGMDAGGENQAAPHQLGGCLGGRRPLALIRAVNQLG